MKIILSDVLTLIKDKKEFRAQICEGNFIKITYTHVTSDSFYDSEGKLSPILTELRGVVFDRISEEIIARPLHKFFNIGEKQETLPEVVEDMTFVVEEKKDGSMIFFFWDKYSMKLRANTKNEFYDNIQIKTAMEIVEKNLALKNFLIMSTQSGFTPIFEIVGAWNQIVVPYLKTDLVLIAIRENKTGEYVNIHNTDMNKICSIVNTETFSYDEIVERVKTLEGVEGYVLKNDKVWVKVKTNWYLDRHHILDAFNLAVWKVARIILNNEIDDLLGNIELNPILKKVIMKLNDDVFQERQKLIDSANDIYSKIIELGLTRKDIGLSDKYSQKEKALIFTLFSGKNIEEVANKMIVDEYQNNYSGVKVNSLAGVDYELE